MFGDRQSSLRGLTKPTMSVHFKLLCSFAIAATVGVSNLSAQDSSTTARNNPFTPSPNTSMAVVVKRTIPPSNGVSSTNPPTESNIVPSLAPINTLAYGYRLGVKDVLRIDTGADSKETTYITVSSGGNSILGLTDTNVVLAGKTPEQIEAELAIMLGTDTVRVTVREYASRFVEVRKEGMAAITIPLRREAVPLFVILSEVEKFSEYSNARLVRVGGETWTIKLSDPQALDLLIYPGDVVGLMNKREPL